MPFARDEAGNIWEVDASGRPVRPVGGDAFAVPPNPAMIAERNRDNARQDNADARADRGDGRAERGEARAERGEGRQVQNDAFSHTTKLAGDYNSDPSVKAYRVAIAQLGQALDTGAGPQADLALTYAFAKAMDPESVVRESEQGMVTNSQPWFLSAVERAKKQFGMDGAGNYTPATRDQLRQQIINSVAKRNKIYNARRQFYTQQAQHFGMDPAFIVGEHDGTPFMSALQAFDRRTGNRNAMMQDTLGPAGPGNLAKGGDDAKSIPIPRKYQAEYSDYVQANRGRLDPDAYARFRSSLDAKYGFGDTTQAAGEIYREEAARINDDVRAGRRLNLKVPPQDRKMSGLDRFNATVFNNPLGAAMLGAGSLGGGMDEAIGAVRSMALGTDYDVERERANAFREASAEAYPGSTIAGNVAGSLALGYGAGSAFPRLAQAFNSAKGVLGTGAGYGAVSGALEDNDNRLRGAGTGAVAGAGGAAAGHYVVAPAVERIARSKAGQAVGNAASGLLESFGGNRPVPAAPEMTAAERSVINLGPDFERIARNLSDAARLKMPYALADADPKLRSLAGAVTRKSVNVRDLAENTFEPRARGQADRAVEAIDTHLAPYTDIEQRGADLLEAGNMASRPYYDMAGQRENPIPVGMEMVTGRPTGGDKELEAILRTPTGKQALQRAHKILADRGGSPEAVGLMADADGNVTLRAGHSFEALDLVKKGMDDIIQDSANPITGKVDSRGKPQLQAIEGLRKRLVDRLDVINPTYKQARDTYAPYAQRKEALDVGYSALPRQDVPERVFNERLAGFDEDTLPEARMGYATSLMDRVNTVRETANPYASIYGSPLQQRKISSLFPDGAEDFNRVNQLERDMGKTTYETLGGSPTAARLQADEQLGGGLGTMALDAASQAGTGGGFSLGSALQAARRVLGDSAKIGMGKQAGRRAETIAPMLFDTTNPMALADLVSEMAGKRSILDARLNAYRKAGGLLGAASGPAGLSVFGP